MLTPLAGVVGLCLLFTGLGRWFMVFGLLPAGEVGLMVASRWGSWLHDYSPLGRGFFLVTSHWGSWFNGYFPLGNLGSGLLPAGGEGGLHDYSPLGERVGFTFSSCWGSWFQGHSPLGERVGFYDHFSLGMLGFIRRKLPGECISDFNFTYDMPHKILFLVTSIFRLALK